MNKRNLFKKVTAVVLAGIVATSASAAAFAEDDDGYAEYFSDKGAQGVSHGKALTEKTREELYQEGYLFYDGSHRIFSISRAATVSNVLGFVSAAGTYNVRANSGGTGTVIGTVKQKDIIKVNSINGNYANITFLDSNNSSQKGYVLSSALYTPAYGWVSPTGLTGKITQYYGDTATNPSGHTGVDIGSVGTTTSLKAVNDGTATFKVATSVVNETTYYVEYGRYVFLDTTAASSNKRVVYAHLSSFNGYETNDYPSEGYPGFSAEKKYTVVGTKKVSQGENLGKTGSSGQATGNHLHFEVRTGTSTSREDPFLYIVFPKITKS